MSKGSKRRPENFKAVQDNWKLIFNNPKLTVELSGSIKNK